jgi:hypothetical protein
VCVCLFVCVCRETSWLPASAYLRHRVGCCGTKWTRVTQREAAVWPSAAGRADCIRTDDEAGQAAIVAGRSRCQTGGQIAGASLGCVYVRVCARLCVAVFVCVLCVCIVACV